MVMGPLREHLSEEIKTLYADDPALVPDRPAVEQHLRDCEPCATDVAHLSDFVGLLRSEETWLFLDQIEASRPVFDLRAFIARCESEDAQAELLLEKPLESHYLFTAANIVRKKRYQTGGVVRLLCEAAWQQAPKEPLFALTLAESAYVIAEALPDDYYPKAAVNQLRGAAWKEASNAHRLLGNLGAALDALTRAERAYRRLTAPDRELAAVDLCRALVLWEQENHDKALALARSAASRLSEGDAKYFEAKECEAMFLHSRGEVEAARSTYASIYELADRLGDTEMKARAANNLAIAARDTGQPEEAKRQFVHALELYGSLGQRATVAHIRWSMARLALFRGDAAGAARDLPGVIDELLRFGMRNYAAHARLDLAEALLILGRHDEAEALCSELVAFYRAAEILTGALTAASYLKEAVKKRAATPRQIEHVRRYLQALERSPNLVFALPPGD